MDKHKKILIGSMVGFLSSIITVVKTVKEVIENLCWISMFTTVWFYIAIGLIMLSISMYIQYKKNKQLENAGVIPIINNRHFLGNVHKKQERSKYIDNNMSIILLEKITEINGTSERKDSKTTMKIYGELLRDSDNFKFIIANDLSSSASKDKITITAKDASNNSNLNVSTLDKDGYNKEFIISYERRRTAGSFIRLEISWVWPKMFDIKNDYITLSTCYSEITKKIKHTLIPHNKQTFDKISLWKYELSMRDALFVREISKQDGVFSYEIENPDKMMDYIICYETE